MERPPLSHNHIRLRPCVLGKMEAYRTEVQTLTRLDAVCFAICSPVLNEPVKNTPPKPSKEATAAPVPPLPVVIWNASGGTPACKHESVRLWCRSSQSHLVVPRLQKLNPEHQTLLLNAYGENCITLTEMTFLAPHFDAPLYSYPRPGSTFGAHGRQIPVWVIWEHIPPQFFGIDEKGQSCISVLSLPIFQVEGRSIPCEGAEWFPGQKGKHIRSVCTKLHSPSTALQQKRWLTRNRDNSKPKCWQSASLVTKMIS